LVRLCIVNILKAQQLTSLVKSVTEPQEESKYEVT